MPKIGISRVYLGCFIFYILVFKYLKFTLIIVNGFLYYWYIAVRKRVFLINTNN